MSCHKCDDEPLETYVRVGAANVMIAGCQEHLKQLLDQNRIGMNAKQRLTDIASDVADEFYPKGDKRRGEFIRDAGVMIAKFLREGE